MYLLDEFQVRLREEEDEEEEEDEGRMMMMMMRRRRRPRRHRFVSPHASNPRPSRHDISLIETPATPAALLPGICSSAGPRCRAVHRGPVPSKEQQIPERCCCWGVEEASDGEGMRHTFVTAFSGT